MSTYRGFLVAGASLLATTIAAQSADLYGAHGGRGSIKDDYVQAAPRGCPTWYARIDGGYTTYDRPAMTQVGIDDHVGARFTDTGTLGGGIGRYFTCSIRGDITVDHRYESDAKGFNANPYAPNYGQMKWGYESTSVMANIYYDFNAGARFTPYIGFGLGGVHNNFIKGGGTVGNGARKFVNGVEQASGAIGTPTTVGAGSDWHVAAAAMTGFVFSMTDRLKLDTGYRFMYLGATKTGQTANAFGGTGGVVHVDSMHAHEFRVGLRYDIR
jgi:opacity protein-like surface antigen